ncbi:MAG: hypothetical protein AAGI51_03360 [Pseudomonadota bacterium]
MTLTRRPTAAAAPLALALALAGCDYVDFAGPQPSAPAGPPTQAVTSPDARGGALMPNAQKLLVDTVDRLEVGRTRSGVLVAAFGSAVETGWFQPALRPLNAGEPGPDGFLEFEFVAAPPELNVVEGEEQRPPLGTPEQRRVKGVRPVTASELTNAAGIRVFAARGAPAALRFDPEVRDRQLATQPDTSLAPAAATSGPALPSTGG